MYIPISKSWFIFERTNAFTHRSFRTQNAITIYVHVIFLVCWMLLWLTYKIHRSQTYHHKPGHSLNLKISFMFPAIKQTILTDFNHHNLSSLLLLVRKILTNIFCSLHGPHMSVISCTVTHSSDGLFHSLFMQVKKVTKKSALLDLCVWFHR